MLIPTDWKIAKQDPKWRQDMMEEFFFVRMNDGEVGRFEKEWNMGTHISSRGKKTVTCKWIYTIKQKSKGKIKCYKAELVASGYNQTYGIDYDETFSSMAKMNTIRATIHAVYVDDIIITGDDEA
jgi:hypothetical protein